MRRSSSVSQWPRSSVDRHLTPQDERTSFAFAAQTPRALYHESSSGRLPSREPTIGGEVRAASGHASVTRRHARPRVRPRASDTTLLSSKPFDDPQRAQHDGLVQQVNGQTPSAEQHEQPRRAVVESLRDAGNRVAAALPQSAYAGADQSASCRIHVAWLSVVFGTSSPAHTPSQRQHRSLQ